MSPEENTTTIVLEPDTITGEDYPEGFEAFDLDPQSAETLQNHIQEAAKGKAINLCL